MPTGDNWRYRKLVTCGIDPSSRNDIIFWSSKDLRIDSMFIEPRSYQFTVTRPQGIASTRGDKPDTKRKPWVMRVPQDTTIPPCSRNALSEKRPSKETHIQISSSWKGQDRTGPTKSFDTPKPWTRIGNGVREEMTVARRWRRIMSKSTPMLRGDLKRSTTSY